MKTYGNRLFFTFPTILILSCILFSCSENRGKGNRNPESSTLADSLESTGRADSYPPLYALLVSPENPQPGENFRIIAAGNADLRRTRIIVSGQTANPDPVNSKKSEGSPYWRIDEFTGASEGNYHVSLVSGKKEACRIDFKISSGKAKGTANGAWKSVRGWDSAAELLYSAWVNSLFYGCDERSSWTSFHEVTRNRENNFLFNHLSLGEDNPDAVNSVIMEPDCADNPFFMRAYFSWKLGLPFGYHICDRGGPGHVPRTGRWVTNQSFPAGIHPVKAFNQFLRKLMDGVHSGTARTALTNDNSDYYPVTLEREMLRPGTVFADPYGHTLIITGWIPQNKGQPGTLLSVDAQPDKTVGIKRFWKGNFMFTTHNVVGEPGFKAFRPVLLSEGSFHLMNNKELTEAEGFVPYSAEQKDMESEVFYKKMERLINPDPLDPEEAMTGLIEALHEQLKVRVTSVANGEAYFRKHPGTVIPMPGTAAGIFQTGGVWEDFSTPNRDLRLLIAMDAVLGFPDKVSQSPDEYDLSLFSSPEGIKKKLLALLEQKISRLSIEYTRSDGSAQKLNLKEILDRREAFEMAYNPNDGAEIRWGAPENSGERAACRRHAPPNQQKNMQSVRSWFQKRLHPPT